ncbi:MAG TPA: DUF5678 domain-containing protein [Acidimicrobiales bacterium]|nr:DUF5678 domain-containing protein [Acidimicrobiales bacterium]
MAESVPPTNSLVRLQHEYPGAWVALKDGGVVEARATPYELVAALHDRGISDATIIRVPAESEPELVELG